MNIQLEKEHIIRQLMLVEDVDLLAAVKSLLAFGLGRQHAGAADADELDEEIPDEVRESIKVSLAEFEAGQVATHEAAMTRLKSRYRL